MVKRRTRLALATLAILVLATIVLRHAILRGLGSYLVSASQPKPADLALVLGGDGFGNRILFAADLERRGLVPKVLVSGPSGMYGNYECDLAIPFAVKAGFPESYFLHWHHNGRSTTDEAHFAAEEFRSLGVHRVLLVTSDYHTRRAGRSFRAANPHIELTVVAAPDKFFSPGGWWENREGRKLFVMEWVKTVAEWFGL